MTQLSDRGRLTARGQAEEADDGEGSKWMDNRWPLYKDSGEASGLIVRSLQRVKFICSG